MIKILRVPLDNRPGQLHRAVTVISGAGVDMKALSLVNQGPDRGEVLLLVSDLPKARKALEKAGLGCSVSSAVVVEVPDRAGGLAAVLAATASAGLSVNEMFTFVTRVAGKALAVAAFDDNEAAERLLQAEGIGTVQQQALADEGEIHPLADYLGGSFFW